VSPGILDMVSDCVRVSVSLACVSVSLACVSVSLACVSVTL
jgi:hypothetical protein